MAAYFVVALIANFLLCHGLEQNPVETKSMHWRISFPRINSREITIFHVDNYGNWSEWGECLPVDCIEIRYRECLDDSWKYFSNDRPDSTRCTSKFYAEKRACKNTSQCHSQIGHQLIKDMNGVCGVKAPSAGYQLKILGGEAAKPHNWPWAVRLSYKLRNGNSVSFCGGTLVTPEWILTAAHCLLYEKSYIPFGKPVLLSDYLKTTIYANLGDHDQTTQESSEINLRAKIAIIHPRYHRRLQTDGYDIALVRLEKPVTTSPEINYACLPTPGLSLKPGTRCYAVGWGSTKGANYAPSRDRFQRLLESFFTPFSNPFSNIFSSAFPNSLFNHKSTRSSSVDKLRQVELPIVSMEQCNQHYSGISSDLHICAGTKGKDTCAGDSGGGLYCQVSDEWTVVGVTSFGMARGCGLNPGVYTSTTAHLDWIAKQLAANLTKFDSAKP